MEKIPPHLKEVYKQYPWLHFQPDAESDYLPPNYYDKLLKPYTFGGRIDLDYFLDDMRAKSTNGAHKNVLEMGSGSGRATDALLAGDLRYTSLDLVDLSKDMVASTREKYKEVPNLTVAESDVLDYLGSTDKKYSYAYSLWGFSYSIHHHMNEMGVKNGAQHSEQVMRKFITENMSSGGSMFIVHPDSLSDEQRVMKSLRQPLVARAKDRQSSSKRVLDAMLERMDKEGLAKAEVTHLVGDPIAYTDMEEALEIFLNFHLHASLNRSRKLPRAIETLKTEFSKYQQPDGIFVAPGCFNYSITSLT